MSKRHVVGNHMSRLKYSHMLAMIYYTSPVIGSVTISGELSTVVFGVVTGGTVVVVVVVDVVVVGMMKLPSPSSNITNFLL